MSLVLEKKLSDTELEQLGIELSLSALDGTLTEKRYDELVHILLEYVSYPDARMGIIVSGQPEWQEKHFKRLNRKVF
jgi:hypothetical protein